MKTSYTTPLLLSMSSLAFTDVSAFTFMQAPQQQQHRQLIGSRTTTTTASNASPLLSQSQSQSTLTSSSSSTILFAGAGVDNKEIDLLEEADEIFDYVDSNGDGVISLEELQTHLVKEMGYTEEYTKYLFASIDTDSDGSITKEEMRFAFYNFEALSMYMTFGVGGSDVTNRKAFKELARKNSSTSPETRDKLLLDDLADLIFDIIDTDSSGEISKEELKTHFENVTSKFGGDDKQGTEKQARDYVSTMFATLDADKDGGICREEIRTAFEKYDFKLLARTFGLRVYRTAEV
ncbi:MAG: Ca2+-binding EF-hand superfamily protein [Bacillariaceae sp.]|jgi:Ca2+-binding EF-hand superfamily protein